MRKALDEKWENYKTTIVGGDFMLKTIKKAIALYIALTVIEQLSFKKFRKSKRVCGIHTDLSKPPGERITYPY